MHTLRKTRNCSKNSSAHGDTALQKKGKAGGRHRRYRLGARNGKGNGGCDDTIERGGGEGKTTHKQNDYPKILHGTNCGRIGKNRYKKT